jgi:tryptophanyl-tRNA synthetase
MSDSRPQRLMSGIQPTGQVHIGNYEGAIRNWVELQHEYDRAFYCVVDYHAATIEYDPPQMRERVLDVSRWLLASGIEPSEQVVLFVQSDVPRHAELGWLLNTVTPMGELGRMTQFKEKSRANEANINVGLFAYPVLQAADILIYQAAAVPVGEDQSQHLELSRYIARRWNKRYGSGRFFFPQPEAHHTPAKRIVGLDGAAKMSKSKNNTIDLADPADVIWDKLRPAKTDERRQRLSDPGEPDDCPMYALHRLYTPTERRHELAEGCRTAAIGCFDCKKVLAENLSAHLAPIQERYHALTDDDVADVLAAGGVHARAAADETLERVREAMGLDGWRSVRRRGAT